MPDNTNPIDSNVSPNSSEIILIPLSQIFLNDNNPRGGTDPELVDTLAASMETEGQKTEIKLRRLENSQYRVVGGDHRVLAAQKLGWTEIRATVLQITQEEAYLEGYLDNQGQKMSWYADYLAIENAWKGSKQAQGDQKAIGKRLMLSENSVGRALKLMPLLNTGARTEILTNRENPGKYKVTENPVYRLIDLATGGPKDQDVIKAALDVLIDHKMTEKQVQKLVDWVKAGNSPETYTPSASSKSKSSKLGVGKTTHPHSNPATPAIDLDKLVELAKKAALEEAQGGATTRQDELKAFLEQVKSASADSHKESTQSKHGPQYVASAQMPNAPMSGFEKAFWDFMAGIPIYKQIDAKLKKGENPTSGEKLLLVWHFLGEGLRWFFKHPWKIIKEFFKAVGKVIKWIFKGLWKLFKEAFKAKGKTGWGKFFYRVGLLIVIGLVGFYLYQHWVMKPLHFIQTKFFHADLSPKGDTLLPPRHQDTKETVSSETVNQTSNPQPTTMPALTPSVVMPPPQAHTKKANSSDDTQEANESLDDMVATAQVPSPTAITSVVKVVPTPAVQKTNSDVIGQVAGQVAPSVAGDVAKKLFGF